MLRVHHLKLIHTRNVTSLHKYHVTVNQAWDKCAKARKNVSTSVRPYPATALLTQSVRSRYFFLFRWVAPAAPCKRRAFCLFMSCFRPSRKVQIVGWWLWNSDCRPWCHPSTEFVVLAIPAIAELVWFQVSTLKRAGPMAIFLPRKRLPLMYVCSKKLTNSFMWSWAGM